MTTAPARGRIEVLGRATSDISAAGAPPVSELRTRADGLARDLRELDVRVQRANWEVDLLDGQG